MRHEKRTIWIIFICTALFFLVMGLIFLQGRFTGKSIDVSVENVVCGNYSAITPQSAVASSTYCTQENGGYDYKSVRDNCHSAGNAVDGNAGTYWRGDVLASYPQWLYVILGGERCVREVRVLTNSQLTMEVQASNDGDNWETIIASWEIGRKAGYEAKTFPEISAKYIRFYQTSGNAKTGTLSEIRLVSAPSIIRPYCTDSDSGKDYDNKGSVQSANIQVPLADECLSNKTLIERFCEGTEEKSEVFLCQDACGDGACLFSVGGQEAPIEASPPTGEGAVTSGGGGSGGGCAVAYQCIIYPPKCPESGLQKRVCVDKLGCGPQREETLICKQGRCLGCVYNDLCLPYGARFRDYRGDGMDKYCDANGIIQLQKDALMLSPEGAEANLTCSYSYECVSNICEENKCLPTQQIVSSAPATQSATVKALCRAANAFDEDEYQSCLLNFLAER